MLNTKYRRLCLVKCIQKNVGGITLNKIYRVIETSPKGVCIYNNYGMKYWYSREYFKEV